MAYFDVVLQDVPDSENTLFVELEDENGKGIGEHPLIRWVQDSDFRRLRIYQVEHLTEIPTGAKEL